MTRLTCVAILALLLLPSATTLAADLPAAETAASPRVLRPSSAQLIEAAFARAGADLRLDDAKIHPDFVLATVCQTAQPSVCHQLELRDPATHCQDRRVGPWCLRYLKGPPPQAEALERALAGDRDAALWSRPPGAPEPPPSPWGLALAWLLVPLAAGLLLGTGQRLSLKRRVAGIWPVLLVLTVLAGLGAGVGFAWMRVGLWDLLSVAGLATAGWGLGAHVLATRRGPFVLAGVTSLLGLIALEAMARILPMPPAFPPAEEASLLIPSLEARQAQGRLHAQSAQAACELLLPQPGATDPLPARLAAPEGTHRRVLHLGDSLAFGSGVPAAQRFTTLLERAEPGVAHLNGAMPGTSIDAQYLLALRALERTPVDLVVLHVFVGNDLVEVDRPYPCCREGPLLTWPAEGVPQPRCKTADVRPERGMTEWYLARSPAPYPLRVLTAVSLAARHLCGLQVRVAQRLDEGPSLPPAVATERYYRAVKALHAELTRRNIPLVLVILPVRSALDAGPRGDAEVVQRLGRDLKVPVLDAWSLFAEAVRSRPEASLFVPEPPGDPHFSAKGHALVADWLHVKLERLTAARAALEGM